MIVERASYNWAYSEDIPGSRCGPDDGPWPRSYQVLDEQEIWRELGILAKPQTCQFDAARGWRADSINFQPSPTTKTQDRYVVTQLDIHGHMWTLTGVFDGHLGDVTVEHVAHHLPIIIRDFLRHALQDDTSRVLTPAFVSDLFSRSIVAFDNAIANDVLDLFGGFEGLDKLSDATIRRIINDQHTGGANWKKARLCMYGTTALVALVDPDHQNLWVANLGDCQAVMVTPDEDIEDWNVEVLTTDHNGDNDAEVERVRSAHPGEPECVVDRRVLGALAPFRCLGDVPFKQPPEFTRRILYNLFPGFHNTSPWEEFLVRNRTPPYITAEPEITHRRLGEYPSSPRFLLLFSDGFADLCSGEGQKRIIASWARAMAASAQDVVPSTSKSERNMALRLLRRAVGGEDRYSVSRVLTLDMDVAWIDDTSIVVQTL
ncbi:phosphatase 2C-like domain-containing protein [Infundibulicybe gibba]|nr:phosphatase 2C-like domain-containing protein [Infundibulicybe gibba]